MCACYQGTCVRTPARTRRASKSAATTAHSSSESPHGLPSRGVFFGELIPASLPRRIFCPIPSKSTEEMMPCARVSFAWLLLVCRLLGSGAVGGLPGDECFRQANNGNAHLPWSFPASGLGIASVRGLMPNARTRRTAATEATATQVLTVENVHNQTLDVHKRGWASHYPVCRDSTLV
jgi:hypothetical protein